MRLPEYSWAQGLLVAVHSLVLAYENNTNCPSMKLEEAAEKLDTLRRRSGTNSRLRMASIRYRRTLDQEQKHRANGGLRMPCVFFHRQKSTTPLSPISVLLRVIPNMHDLTEVGAHPYRQLEMLRGWINRHLSYGFAKPGSLGEGTFFGTEFIILWIDAHNGFADEC